MIQVNSRFVRIGTLATRALNCFHHWQLAYRRSGDRETNHAPARKKARVMPITPFLKGQVFEPEITRAMGIAFENASKILKLVDRSNPLTELVAAKIIELAAMGERDPERLCAGVLAVYKSAAE